MRKTKSTNKQNNQPGERGMFYDSKKCFICGKLIWGSSPKNHRLASKDCYFKMKAHREEHEKEKQLDLPIHRGKQEEVQTVRKVTLRDEEKNI